MSRQQYIRINFQIPSQLFNSFVLCAESAGVTKASLLRRLLEDFTFDKAMVGQQNLRLDDQISFFNLRLPDYLYSIMCARAKQMHMGKGDYLVRVVEWGVTNLSSVTKTTRTDFEISLQNALHQVEQGDLVLAVHILDELEQSLSARYREQLVFARIDAIRGLIARHNRKFDASEAFLASAYDIAINSTDSDDVRAFILDQRSVLAEIREDIDAAKQLAESAQYGGNEVRMMLRFANFAAQQGCSQESLRLLEKVEARRPAGGWPPGTTNRIALAYSRLGQTTKALALLNSALPVAQSEGLKSEVRYILENKTILNMCNLPIGESIQTLQKIIELEDKFRVGIPHPSKAKYAYYFLLASQGDESSKHALSSMVRLQHRPVYQNLGKYYLYALDYLYSSPSNQLLAEQKLQRLSKQPIPTYIANSIGHLISTKALTPQI